MNNPALALIKQLRLETGAGVQDCRKALEQFNHDYGEALGFLREKGLEKAANRADRPALQGVVEVYSHGNGRVGVMVEVNCETDFSARSPAFRSFAHELALQVAAAAPRYVRDEDIPAQVLVEEAQKAEARARQEGKPEAIVSRIVIGMLEKYKNQTVLLRQAYIRDDSLTVDQLLNQAIAAVRENITIRRIVRWEAGEENDCGIPTNTSLGI
jgi:elongation factor Ts